ncbi:MAG: transcriptional regulator NrdR [Kiritimatiellales bacterium]|jgi:transcriptional repressor NrdR|nr:transcriptional regulator NrdR [Kiritimatiellales bacterium]
MKCPKCEHRENKVIDSREVREGSAIRRRRLCLNCGHRFTTYEEVLRAALQVIKRDGRREELSREKLMQSIAIACQKRPISIQQIEQMTNSVITQVEAEYEREVPSTALGTKMMALLEKLDEVAYVRFASVYRRFKDVNQFMNEAERLIGRE